MNFNKKEFVETKNLTSYALKYGKTFDSFREELGNDTYNEWMEEWREYWYNELKKDSVAIDKIDNLVKNNKKVMSICRGVDYPYMSIKKYLDDIKYKDKEIYIEDYDEWLNKDLLNLQMKSDEYFRRYKKCRAFINEINEKIVEKMIDIDSNEFTTSNKFDNKTLFTSTSISEVPIKSSFTRLQILKRMPKNIAKQYFPELFENKTKYSVKHWVVKSKAKSKKKIKDETPTKIDNNFSNNQV